MIVEVSVTNQFSVVTGTDNMVKLTVRDWQGKDIVLNVHPACAMDLYNSLGVYYSKTIKMGNSI